MNPRVMVVGRTVVFVITLCAMGSSPSAAVPRARAAFQSSPVPNLAAYWPFDANENDLSGNANNGTLFGGAVLDPGVAPTFPPANAGSLSCPAIHAYVTVPTSASLQISGSLTLAAWVNTTLTPSVAGTPPTTPSAQQQGIIEKWGNSGASSNNGYFLRLDDALCPSFTLFPATAAQVGISTYPRPISNSAWHHIAGVYDSATGSMTIYVDGIADAGSGSSANPPGADASQLRIGSDYGANNFIGNLDEVRIYSTALSAAEIGTLMTGQNPPTGLSVTPGQAQITLNWTGAVAASSYNVYRSTTGAGGPYTLYANTALLTYTDLGVTNPNSYSYEVTAVGALESAPDGPVTAVPMPPPPSGPKVPTADGSKTLAQRCGCSSIPPSSGVGPVVLALAVALLVLLGRR